MNDRRVARPGHPRSRSGGPRGVRPGRTVEVRRGAAQAQLGRRSTGGWCRTRRTPCSDGSRRACSAARARAGTDGSWTRCSPSDDGTTAVYSFRYSWQSTGRPSSCPAATGASTAHSAHVVASAPRPERPDGPGHPRGRGVRPSPGRSGRRTCSSSRTRSTGVPGRRRPPSDRARRAAPAPDGAAAREPGRSTSWRIEHGWVFTWVDGRTDVEQILPMFEVVTRGPQRAPHVRRHPVRPARPVA